MRKMPRKVVRAELAAGIEAELLEILGPFRDERPPSGGKANIALHVRERGKRDYHVAALLHGHQHALLLALLAAAVDLPFSERIEAKIMRREGPRPAGMACVHHDWRKRGAEESGAHEKKMRRLGIENVNRADESARPLLLRKIDGLVVLVRHKLARGE